MDNRFFSLIIVPDSGNDVKYSSFNSQFLIAVFGSFIVSFLICLFFIIGYHVKLRQEQSYQTAIHENQQLRGKIRETEKTLETLSAKLENIHKSDNAYRLYASMNTLDPDMYQAGVGGRVIFDHSEFEGLDDELLLRMELITYSVTRIEHQTELGRKSLTEIQTQLRRNREIINNTPTIWPAVTSRLYVTSNYGTRRHPITGRRHFHDAIDIGGRRGDRIIAAADGVVTWASWKGNLGNCVIIRHKYGYETLYAHLNGISVKTGQSVKKGETIGAMGSTGRTTGVHLHYSVYRNGQTINPRMLLRPAS